MKALRCSLLLAVLLFWGALLPVQARPQLKLEASPRELSLGQSLQLTLTLVQDAGERGAMIDTSNLALPELPGFEVLSRQSSSNFVSNNQQMRMMVQTQYQLRPLKSGELTIPSLTFNYQENGKEQQLATEPVIIKVAGSAGRLEWLWWLAGLVGLGIMMMALRRKRPRSEQARTEQTRTEQKSISTALKAQPKDPLEGFEQRLQQGEDPLLLLEDLYIWFRELAARRGWLPASGASHQEVLRHVRFNANIKAETLQSIEDFLAACEQVRFAKQELDAERFGHLLELARRFA